MRRHSLRGRLAALGMIAILVPLVILLGVVFAVESDQEIQRVDATNIEVTTTRGVSPWIPLTAALLTIPAAALVWAWSSRAVKPIMAITELTNDIQAGSLDRRIGLDAAPSEVQALGDSFDDMLDRLASASKSQLQLIEDTSHELRTPLAALAVNTEVVLDHPSPTLDDYRQSAQRSRALIERLQQTIEQQLSGARSRAQMTEQTNNDLIEIVRSEAEDLNAALGRVAILVTGPSVLRLGIDGDGVARAVRNLMQNAVQVGTRTQTVAVAVYRNGDDVYLSVTDQGPGVDPADHERIFDRYYSTEPEGHGIGLALVKQVAEAHGHIEIESPVRGGRGTRFVLVFHAT